MHYINLYILNLYEFNKIIIYKYSRIEKEYLSSLESSLYRMTPISCEHPAIINIELSLNSKVLFKFFLSLSLIDS